MVKTITVKGMTCGHCSSAVTNALKDLGLTDATVDLEKGTASFTEQDGVDVARITAAIEEEGYTVE